MQSAPNRLSRRSLVKFVALGSVAPLLLACGGIGGFGGQGTPPTETPGKSSSSTSPTVAAAPNSTKPAGGATPTVAGKAPSSAPASSKDPSSRIGDSVTLLLDEEKPAFSAYHLEITMSDQSWNKDAKKIETKTSTYKVDVAGKDIHIISTTKAEGKPDQTSEGYIINGGISNSDNGGKEYELKNGKLTDSFGMSLGWAFLPLAIVMPLSVGSLGASAAGEEAVDGRAAEKYTIDTSKAPAGSMAAMSALFTITSAKGTVWVDKQSGALLKALVEYEQQIIDPPGSKTVVGTGNGKLDMAVSQVGKATVTLPK